MLLIFLPCGWASFLITQIRGRLWDEWEYHRWNWRNWNGNEEIITHFTSQLLPIIAAKQVRVPFDWHQISLAHIWFHNQVFRWLLKYQTRTKNVPFKRVRIHNFGKITNWHVNLLSVLHISEIRSLLLWFF